MPPPPPPPPPPPQPLPPTFCRVLVHVRFGPPGAEPERLSTRLLLGPAGSAAANTALLCQDQRFDFAAVVNRLPRYADQVALFFLPRVNVPAVFERYLQPAEPEMLAKRAAASNAKGDKALEDAVDALRADVRAYNLYNLLGLLFPATLAGWPALATSNEASKPPELAAYGLFVARPKYSYLYGNGGAAATSAASPPPPGASAAQVAGGGNGRRRRTKIRERMLRWRKRVLLSRGAAADGGAATGVAGGGATTSSGGAGAPPRRNTTFCTVLRTTWLNDAINHPAYFQFASTVLQYNKWYKDDYDFDPIANSKRDVFINAIIKPTFKVADILKSAVDQLGGAPGPDPTDSTTYDPKLIGPSPGRTRNVLALAWALDHMKAIIKAANGRDMTMEEKKQLVSHVEVVAITQKIQESLKGSVGNEYQQLTPAIQTIGPLLAAYRPAFLELRANSAIASANAQFATLPDGVGDFIKATPLYAPFVRFVGALESFSAERLPGNPKWRNYVVNALAGRGTNEQFKNLAKACSALVERTADVLATRRNGGGGANAALNYAAELIDVGLDRLPVGAGSNNVGKNGKGDGKGDTAALAGGSVPMYEAYIQVDVVGFVVGPENYRSVSCGLQDYLLGISILEVDNRALAWPPGRLRPRIYYA
jgi:hypothetical protein